MAKETNEQVRSDILDALGSGMNTQEIAEMLGLPYANVSQYLRRMMDEGLVERQGRGVYTPVKHNGTSAPAAATTRRVEIPPYMKGRKPVTLFIERSPIEIEGVIRFEVQIGNNWFALPVTEALRVCVGDDIPRWSAIQETYNGVSAYRVTTHRGEQEVHFHNPETPLTVDAK